MHQQDVVIIKEGIIAKELATGELCNHSPASWKHEAREVLCIPVSRAGAAGEGGPDGGCEKKRSPWVLQHIQVATAALEAEECQPL